MKQMKKIAVFIIAIVLSFSMFSCGDKEKNTGLDGTMTIVIAEISPTVYTVDLSKVEITKGVVSILEYLMENQGLDYVLQESEYGAFLTKIGSLQQDSSAGKYIYIYTSVEKDFDVSAYATTVSFENKTLTSSGFGLTEMTIQDESIIYFDIISF